MPRPGVSDAEVYGLRYLPRGKMREMKVTVKVPDELAALAREKGLSVEVYVEQVLVEQCNGHRLVSDKSATIAEAVARIREIGKGNKLDGENIKDWIHEGHKY